MRKVLNGGSILACGLILAGAILVAGLQSADARLQYYKAFQKKYPQVKAAKKARCNVCHMGKKKKPRNPYGKVLEKLVPKKNCKDAKSIDAFFTKAEKMKIKKKDEKTIGQLLKEGKLPYKSK